MYLVYRQYSTYYWRFPCKGSDGLTSCVPAREEVYRTRETACFEHTEKSTQHSTLSPRFHKTKSLSSHINTTFSLRGNRKRTHNHYYSPCHGNRGHKNSRSHFTNGDRCRGLKNDIGNKKHKDQDRLSTPISDIFEWGASAYKHIDVPHQGLIPRSS